MGRIRRYFVGEEFSSYHIISRVAGGDLILSDKDKEYFINLMFKLLKGYYVKLVSYTVMSNHFHILLTNGADNANNAGKDDLIARYKDAFGENAEHPEGSYIRNSFEIDYDEDGGIERLRSRLGSVSRFVQDLKQRYTKWYNIQHNRKGTLWSDRFKDIAIGKGDAELICSAYIDLNAVRAGIVKKPEGYRWSSIGLRVRDPRKARRLLSKIILEKETITTFTDSTTGKIKQKSERHSQEVIFLVYQSFVYESGKVDKEGMGRISEKYYEESRSILKRLGIKDNLRYRYRNITEGIAFGNYKLVAELQEKFGRKFIRPRKVTENEMGEDVFYSTRKLSSQI